MQEVKIHENSDMAIDTLIDANAYALQEPFSKLSVERKPCYDFAKRTFDIIISLLCLTIGAPVYLFLILAVFLDEPGNPFFIQERVGLHGKVFHMVKFRTMCHDAENYKSELQNECESDIHFKMKNDPRITKLGKFLRATSLDETPQVINVLLNHMSIVGPRAYIRSEQCRLPEDRLQVKPGLTCYWQITDTTKMSYEEQLELDYKYIRERGVLSDLKLIGKTMKMVMRRGNF